MADIRILPMSMKEFGGKTVKEVQSDFFLNELPSRERGQYFYLTRGLTADPGTIVLFQYNNKIVATAVYEATERFDKSQGPYRGALNFKVDSIRVFDPMGPETLRNVWPEFERFSQTKQSLNPKAYREFERRMKGIDAPFWPVPQASDLAPPASRRIKVTSSRILRDTKRSGRVKFLHGYKCQLRSCGHSIVLSDGSRYAEAHHIKPLGNPHSGPDIMENILCLCPNHHAACDLGAMRLVKHELREVAGHEVGEEYVDYHNRIICSRA